MTVDPRRGLSNRPMFPADMPAVPGPAWKVAVVSDAGAPVPDHAGAVSGISHDVELLERHSGLGCEATVLTARDAADLAGQLHRLPLEVGAVFLTRTERSRAGEAQRTLAGLGGRPLLTDDDAAAVVLTAAVLTYLTRLHRPLFATRAVIAGAATMPVMCPMLLTAGIFDITLWNPGESGLPLAGVARHADVVVNLLGAEPTVTHAALDRPIDSVIGIDGDEQPLLALPGLLRAIAGTPSPIAGAPGPLMKVRALCAAAGGLVAATPGRRLLPSGHSTELTYQVAHSVSRVLNPAYPPGPVADYPTTTGSAGDSARPERC